MGQKIGVILNGPPGCGKDTIANEIVKLGMFVKHQFKDALYEATAKHFGVDLEQFIQYASDRDKKDSHSLAGLDGLTPRQALIHVSENIYKPRYGSDYFGKVEATRVRELVGRMGGNVAVIYPDGGFADEISSVRHEYDFVVLIRLHRDGFDFSRDSRNYIHIKYPNVLTYDVRLNDGDVEAGVDAVLTLIQETKASLDDL